MQHDAVRAAPSGGSAALGPAAPRQRDMNEFPRRFGHTYCSSPSPEAGWGRCTWRSRGLSDDAQALRHQDGAAAPGGQGVPAALPRRGQGRRAAVPRQPGAGVRLGAGRRRDLPGDGLRRGARTCARPGTAAPRRASRSPSTSPSTSSRSWRAGCTTRTASATSSWFTATSRRPTCCCRTAGEVKLTDFGLASSTLKLEKTAPGIIYGKVSYMSPEQARGETLDGRTDLYASGIILWELLTGRQLFPSGKAPGAPKDGQTSEELLRRVRSPEMVPPSKPRVARAARAGSHRAEGAGARSRSSATRAARSCATSWRRSWPRPSPATDSARWRRSCTTSTPRTWPPSRREREELIADDARVVLRLAAARRSASQPEQIGRGAASGASPRSGPKSRRDRRPGRHRCLQSPSAMRTHESGRAPRPSARTMISGPRPHSRNRAQARAPLSDDAEVEAMDDAGAAPRPEQPVDVGASGTVVGGRYYVRKLSARAAWGASTRPSTSTSASAWR